MKAKPFECSSFSNVYVAGTWGAFYSSNFPDSFVCILPSFQLLWYCFCFKLFFPAGNRNSSSLDLVLCDWVPVSDNMVSAGLLTPVDISSSHTEQSALMPLTPCSRSSQKELCKLSLLFHFQQPVAPGSPQQSLETGLPVEVQRHDFTQTGE